MQGQGRGLRADSSVRKHPAPMGSTDHQVRWSPWGWIQFKLQPPSVYFRTVFKWKKRQLSGLTAEMYLPRTPHHLPAAGT